MIRAIPLLVGLTLGAAFNASLNRGAEGELAAALRDGKDPQIAKVAGIIGAVDPDVIALNEFDYGAGNDRAFVTRYLGGAYPFSFIAPSNTGLRTGLDLNGDGVVGGVAGTYERANDSHGFGAFEGQYGMVVLSKHEIDAGGVRTFRNFRWKDMPGARLPVRPDGAPFYSDEALEVLRLSSKSHWDVPVRVDGGVVHFLVSHPTPPVFDGPEDRNGARDADEIRLWAEYIAGAGYLHDDAGRQGGLPGGALFVIAGDLNADPADGESVPGAAQQLTGHPLVNAAERRRGGRGGGPGRGECRPARRPALRYGRFRRRGARQPAGGLRAAFGGARDHRCRGVLARRRRAGGGAHRRLRPPAGLGRRHPSRRLLAAVALARFNEPIRMTPAAHPASLIRWTVVGFSAPPCVA